jgi:hypothetical protein
MHSPDSNHPSVDTLLAVMSEQLKNVLKTVDSIEKKLDTKVDLESFKKLELSFNDIEKDVKFLSKMQWVASGAVAAIMWTLQHLLLK